MFLSRDSDWRVKGRFENDRGDFRLDKGNAKWPLTPKIRGSNISFSRSCVELVSTENEGIKKCECLLSTVMQLLIPSDMERSKKQEVPTAHFRKDRCARSLAALFAWASMLGRPAASLKVCTPLFTQTPLATRVRMWSHALALALWALLIPGETLENLMSAQNTW